MCGIALVWGGVRLLAAEAAELEQAEVGRAELKRRHAERTATKYAGAAMAVLGELKAD